jgi:UDP-N-acetylmuramoyl-L-alanyl-D-glutamate--2,6-diaminopimelate ligase
LKLNGLLKGVAYTLLQGDETINIKQIAYDSRRVTEQSVFVCITGFETDGHQYIKDAILKGCHAIVVERDVEVDKNITVIKVENTRETLAKIANRYYDFPSEKFKLVGITGTNGKTSSVFLINNILKNYKHKTGIIGTIENRIGNRVLATSRTTPESLELQQIFSSMADENINTAIMEVSSHALDLYRVEGCEFDIGAFTNLTLDHLDYHKTMENYRDAKLKLFNMCKIGVINLDDPYGKYMKAHSNCISYITYSCEEDNATIKASNIVYNIDGSSFEINYQGEIYKVHIQTPGKFSVYNALTAIGVSLALSVPIGIIQETLSHESKVAGRFQTIASPTGFHAIVDYAHTPDGLLNVLNTINEFAQGSVITVFGCGGDRDKTKRPEMAKIASEGSDYVIITSDNPRTEDAMAILRDVEAGMTMDTVAYDTIVDRKEAILKALSMAKENDIILVAGKGHEDYQIIGKEKIYFDDSVVIQEYFKTLTTLGEQNGH